MKFTNKKPEKRLLVSLKHYGGRNSSGRITVRHRGGGVKRFYRIVDFGQGKIDMPGKVAAIEYDPYRTAYLTLVEYHNGDKGYVLAAKDLRVGDEVVCADSAAIKIGNRLKLKNIPVGTQIFNVELEPGHGGKLARVAGASVKVVAQEGNFSHIEFASKEIKKLANECFATVGQASHADHRFEVTGKAGNRRRKGWRPSVRGTAMNPLDHPHGGGEGKTSLGMKYPKTPWGKPARGVRTRRPRKWTDKLIVKKRHQ